MRYLTYRSGTGLRLGSLQNDFIVDVAGVAGSHLTSLRTLIEAGPQEWQRVAAVLQSVAPEELATRDLAVSYQNELVAASLPDPPKNIVCLGRNYYKHYQEGARARGESEDAPPAAPIYFTKPATSIIGPFDPLPYDPEVSTKLDWEAELGVIIGVGGRKIKAEDAWQHVFGYTVINDLTARDLQFRHQQWFKGKGLDYSCPLGPLVVTPDELPSPPHLAISLTVNGVTKQAANTGQLMFDIPAIIADLSLSHRLEAGDIISTGTPDGVGHFANPPEYLASGDIMETEIAGIGRLRNQIVPLDRFEIVERYNSALQAVLAVIAQITPESYEQPTACLGWSVKDLVAHLTNSAVNVPILMQRQIERHPNAGKAALDERNKQGVVSRRGRSISSMTSELIAAHYRNIDFFLYCTDDELQITGPLVSGEVITVEERFRRAAKHYGEHGAQIQAALNDN